MHLTLLSLLASPAGAGYGDHDAVPHPTWSERELHLWTNAVRVDPQAFAAEYQAGGCRFEQFTSTEKQPHPPLFHDLGLIEAAVAHSADMAENDWFDHDSSDGTPWDERIRSYYDGTTFGENIAWNYANNRVAVTEGWMCSSGHRANITSGTWNELGTGVVDRYYTQDFGKGTVDTVGPVATGVHSPEEARGAATFYVDWLDRAAPAALDVVVDGAQHPAELAWGTEQQGVFSAEVPVVGCFAYHFAWQTADGATGTFPEEGDYLGGVDCPAQWTPRDEDAGTEPTGTTPGASSTTGGAGSSGGTADGTDERTWGGPESTAVGCASAPVGVGLLWFAGLASLASRRRATRAR